MFRCKTVDKGGRGKKGNKEGVREKKKESSGKGFLSLDLGLE